MKEKKVENISQEIKNDSSLEKSESEILYSLTLDQLDCFNSIVDGLKDQPIRIDHFAIHEDASVSLVFKPLSLQKLQETQ
jgi:hypothetical protein